MYDLIREKDFTYAFDPSSCADCGGRCCTGESGTIKASKAEIDMLAKFMQMTYDEFVHVFMEKRGYQLTIRERKHDTSYDCIFFDRSTQRCKVYEVRPKQCRTFPFWDYYKERIDELKHECPGIIDE